MSNNFEYSDLILTLFSSFLMKNKRPTLCVIFTIKIFKHSACKTHYFYSLLSLTLLLVLAYICCHRLLVGIFTYLESRYIYAYIMKKYFLGVHQNYYLQTIYNLRNCIKNIPTISC